MVSDDEISPSPQCPYEIKPFPYEWCEGCINNGCYPWNHNPVVLCSELGGVFPILLERENGIPMSCLSYRKIDEEMWQAHLKDLKREAQTNEEMRKRAWSGKVFSSEKLP